jgi:predicted ester cyclase
MVGFPDLHFYIVDMSWERSNIYVRFRARGTHRGIFWETLPSNKPVILSGLMVANISDTKIRGLWFYWDPQSVFLFS